MDKIQELQQQIDELKKKVETQQLYLPIDIPSMQALNQALISNKFNRVMTDSVFLTTGNSVNPSIEGQVVYHNNSGSPVLKVYINGAVKTFTVV